MNKSIALPLLESGEVYHVGTMDQNMKGRTHNRFSQEGNGLSVSTEPLSWRRIAKLGGNPIWSVKKGCGNLKFVDSHAMKPKHWKAVTDWALKEGYIEPTVIGQLSWIDGETEERVMMEFDISTPEGEARMNKEHQACMDDWYEDLKLETAISFGVTSKMTKRLGFEQDIIFARDMALTFFVEDALFDQQAIDGVWWKDKDDPENYSAPRGVIHLRALPNCSVAECAQQGERVGGRPRQRQN